VHQATGAGAAARLPARRQPAPSARGPCRAPAPAALTLLPAPARNVLKLARLAVALLVHVEGLLPLERVGLEGARLQADDVVAQVEQVQLVCRGQRCERRLDGDGLAHALLALPALPIVVIALVLVVAEEVVLVAGLRGGLAPRIARCLLLLGLLPEQVVQVLLAAHGPADRPAERRGHGPAGGEAGLLLLACSCWMEAGPKGGGAAAGAVAARAALIGALAFAGRWEVEGRE
jgi:hypothetical protein